MCSLRANNYQATLSQIQAQFNQIAPQAGASNDLMMNSAFGFGFADDFLNIASGDDNQTEYGIQSLVNHVMSILSMIGNNEASTATKEVQDDNNQINQTTDNAINFARTGNVEIDAYIQTIEENCQTIQNALDMIQEKTKEVQEAEKTLQEKEEIVKKNIETINNPNASKEEKQTALQALHSTNAEITELALKVVEFSKDLIDSEKTVVDATAKIEEAMSGASNKTIEIAKELANAAQKDATEGAQAVTKEATNGATNQGNGAALDAIAAAQAGSSLLTFGATSGMAAETAAKAVDQHTAGGIRIGGSAKTMATLGSSLNKIGGEYADVATYAKTIGQAGIKATELLGSYGQSFTNLFSAVGNWLQVYNDGVGFESELKEIDDAVNNGQEVKIQKCEEQNPDKKNNNDGSAITIAAPKYSERLKIKMGI